MKRARDEAKAATVAAQTSPPAIRHGSSSSSNSTTRPSSSLLSLSSPTGRTSTLAGHFSQQASLKSPCKEVKEGGDPKEEEKENNIDNSKFACPLCLDAISHVVESSCCGVLYCQSCAQEWFGSSSSRSSCPSCRAIVNPPPNDNDNNNNNTPSSSSSSWKHSKWIQREIDAVAPKCPHCPKNVFPEDRDRHNRQRCEGQNVKCFKCLGKGAFDVVHNEQDDDDDDDNESAASTVAVTCDACGGNQFLRGLQWKQCFVCLGTGSSVVVTHNNNNNNNSEQEKDVLCKACEGMGALKACFRCGGKGRHEARNGGDVACKMCEGKGALDVDWTKCFKCGGQGAYDGGGGGGAKKNDAQQQQQYLFGCYACSGRGVLRGRAWTKCFKCRGRGVLVIDNKKNKKNSNGGYLEPCDACNAKAALEGTDWTECFVCGGEGLSDLRGMREACLCCTGIGAVKEHGSVVSYF